MMFLSSLPQHRSTGFNNFPPSSSKAMEYTQYDTKPLPLTPIHPNHHPRNPKLIKPKPIISSHKLAPYTTQSASIQRRNARERNRVKAVNDGFTNLRHHIPSEVIASLTHDSPSSAAGTGRTATRKLSKVDTLKLTVEYIRRLQEVLMMSDTESDGVSSESQPCNSYSVSSEDGFLRHNYASSSSRSSEISSSPAPSIVSDTSSSGYRFANQMPAHQAQANYEHYDSGDPQDDELLDCITWWQQQ